MSQSSLLKKIPSLFRQENLKKAQILVRQPTSLAVFASLGFHGLLWFGLPLMSSSQQKPLDTQRTVQVVELSPLEQSRLPQSPLSRALAPLPNSMLSKPVDPLGIGSTPDAFTPSDATPYYNIPPDPTAFSDSTASDSASSKRSGSKTADRSDKPDKTSDKLSKDTKDTEPEEPEDAGAEGTDTSPSKKASDLEGTKPPEELAKVQQEEQERLRSLFAYNSEDPDIKGETALNNLKEFSEKNGISVYDWSKVENISVPLPKEACQFKDEVSTAIQKEIGIGAIVQPDGKPSKVVLLQSSGSKGLNKAAVDFVKAQKFDANEKNNFLRFRISFDPAKTDCATASSPKSDS